MNTRNTLFLGNGFSRSLFSNVPAWTALFPGLPKELVAANPTLAYEIYRKKEDSPIDQETEFKKSILASINAPFDLDKISFRSDEVSSFGELLAQNNVGDIITTNYDVGIELILTKKCGYVQIEPADLVPEEIYSIRTYKMYQNNETGHAIKLWKIHGDGDLNAKIPRIKSVTLGFDQYCGAIAKEYDYVKGEYCSNQRREEIAGSRNPRPECRVPLKKKCCGTAEFDGLSWIELFFSTNVYFVGFGMSFSEIDIWWLLNQHFRLKETYPQSLSNAITFLDNRCYSVSEEIKTILDLFGVHIKEIECIEKNPHYLSDIFHAMK